MHVQQAIFTSTDRGQIKGYQLVAMSEGIDRHTAHELGRWSPSQVETDDSDHWIVSYYVVSEERVAVARTMLGGAEYSGRGNQQVVTSILVLDRGQFSAYENNALSVCRSALTMGGLRLPARLPSRLEPLELPDFPFPSPRSEVDCRGPDDGSWSRSRLAAGLWCEPVGEAVVEPRWQAALRNGQRIAVVGARHVWATAEAMLHSLSHENRPLVSFTTGLPPSLKRPFQVHFLPQVTPQVSQFLKSEAVSLVDLRTPHVLSGQ